MMISWHRKRRWFVAIDIGWWALVIVIIGPTWAFEAFYLRWQPMRGIAFESGYRIFSEGMRDHIEGCSLKIAEQCVWQSEEPLPRGIPR